MQIRFRPGCFCRALIQRALLVTLVWALMACETSSRRRPSSTPPQPAYGQQPYGAPPPGYGQQPPPAQGGYAQPSAPPVAGDPIGALDMGWLRRQADVVLRQLVAALPPAAQQRVATIPLVYDSEPGEVNAFAACIDGRALMAITDGMLEIEAFLAQARANDEVFGTRKVDEYIALLARNQAGRGALVRPPPGFFDPAHQRDSRRVARQYQVFDEQLAFVMGHELAHHHLGHLPCTGGSGPLGAGEAARALSSAVPLFNQPNELAADFSGTQNVLAAGTRQQGYRWTEAGGLLTMQFFMGLDQMAPVDILFSFERTHPPPQVRVPVIQQSANAWRLTGGAYLPIPAF